ncbi:hypothetical protein ACP275_10G120800 [Erythranthe tilingii]
MKTKTKTNISSRHDEKGERGWRRRRWFQFHGGGYEEDDISDLPQGLLQRIVYFLSQEEVVRTSILSKSWCYVWCTRPNLDFFRTQLQRKQTRIFIRCGKDFAAIH